MPRPANTPEELWSKVDKRGPDECWPWLGFKNEQGYGRTWINDYGYYAHRVIYSLAYPDTLEWSAPKDKYSDQFLLHTCDNTSCCNPAHLRKCTLNENNKDKMIKGRAKLYPKDTGPRCKLTMEKAREIRRLRETGITARELAIKYEISLPSIKTLLRGDSYKE